ncbi:MAG: succinate dehydrogenase assembly factor 2 [Woeseiaceae bacterium]|nr:succinate dehydrogenase assembly factor 2 [Woeseiaceae bacterium]
MTDERRLRWQCRRGMRELDVLLTRYLENDYPTACEDDKQAFGRLLDLTDPELAGYLLKGGRSADPGIDRILQQLRG